MLCHSCCYAKYNTVQLRSLRLQMIASFHHSFALQPKRSRIRIGLQSSNQIDGFHAAMPRDREQNFVLYSLTVLSVCIANAFFPFLFQELLIGVFYAIQCHLIESHSIAEYPSRSFPCYSTKILLGHCIK